MDCVSASFLALFVAALLCNNRNRDDIMFKPLAMPQEYRQASETVQAEGRRGSDSGITKVESGECLPKKLKALALEEERQDKRRK